TSEAVRAADLLAKRRLSALGITCAIDSELSKVCDLTVALPTADEKSMVMTRSFTSMLQLLIQLASAQSNGVSGSLDLNPVSAALAKSLESLNSRMEAFVAKHTFADYIYLAQGPLFPIAREGALKVTEMSCSYAQPYHTLEFRHGPKSIVAPETCLAFLLSETGMERSEEHTSELQSLTNLV